MLLAGTLVTVDRQGTEIPVEQIAVGQKLWNPLTDAEVEVVRVLTRPVPPQLAVVPRALQPHLLPAGALHPGQPGRPLEVLPGLRCLCPVPGTSGIWAFDACTLRDRNLPLVPIVRGVPGEIVLILTVVPSLVAVAGILVCLDCPEDLQSGAVPPQEAWVGMSPNLH